MTEYPDSEEEPDSDEDIHKASEESPILTSYEPNFQRVFARGTLLRADDSDENTVEMAFWSTKDENIEMESEEAPNAVGYRLEAEVMMHWDGVLRLRNLLDSFIEDNLPEQYEDSEK